MTDEPPKKDENKNSDVEQLRDEFTAQFATLKTSFEDELKKVKDENTALKQNNEELKRALVASAVNPAPAPAEKEKTPEELYKEKIDALSKKTLELMKGI